MNLEKNYVPQSEWVRFFFDGFETAKSELFEGPVGFKEDERAEWYQVIARGLTLEGMEQTRVELTKATGNTVSLHLRQYDDQEGHTGLRVVVYGVHK